ncbi:hypothetical protein IAI10_00240 [Clostridium sp. 19966]|uniref:hypothetical protein n=1 Tax=Clostridium sp. 19966 TaxID=2768166 RepID=UPI0028E094AC|nr:hypothetical protein [Clostridium sp. 19966]MDT8715108.1 hypothetical protein [Clostridium sp. 19966]
MSDNKNKSSKVLNPFDKLIKSIDNLLIEGKEQKLKLKLSREIKDSIFTEEIVTKLNENDFAGLVDEEESVVSLFSTIFPIFIKKDDIVFRLYKHKIEVDLSDEMRDRYIYIFSDGRLTSGLFQCFTISEDEYVYGIKKIIDAIPLFRKAILEAVESFQENISVHNSKLEGLKDKEPLADKNYKELVEYLNNSLK